MKITAKQAAQDWNISIRRVQDYCKTGKIKGAERFGNAWMIPPQPKPIDRRRKETVSQDLSETEILRKSPFLDMTDLYSIPGKADEQIAKLAFNKETQILFEAAITYSRAEIEKVYNQAREFLKNRNNFYSIISGGILISLVAMWKGDVLMWNDARRFLLKAPCENDIDRDILALSITAVDSAIRDTHDFPSWFKKGCFDKLPADAHPTARVYYVKHLMIMAQDLAMGKIKMPDVSGLALMKTLPFIIEPMISQTVEEKIVLCEIYLRLLCAIAYHHCSDEESATEHLDKAIKLCLADNLYSPLVEHRRQLGTILDDRLALIDPLALKKVKTLHKQLNAGWTKLHNDVLKKTISANLTPREREVARFVVYGFKNSQIANKLFISEAAVKTTIRSIKNKTNAEKRHQFIDFI